MIRAYDIYVDEEDEALQKKGQCISCLLYARSGSSCTGREGMDFYFLSYILDHIYLFYTLSVFTNTEYQILSDFINS